MIGVKLSRRNVIAGLGTSLALLCGVVAYGPPANAATTSLAVRGTVSCDSGAVVGIYIKSSGGGSTFVNASNMNAYPNSPSSGVAIYHQTIKTGYPTNLNINVGCGGSASNWQYPDDGPTLTRSSGATIAIDEWCTDSTKKCAWGKAPSDSGSTSTNPFTGACWCTNYAANEWKSMTGKYPDWSGNAGIWVAHAKTAGWSTSAFARPRSLFVQVTDGSDADPGHVGYVNDVRLSGGIVQIEIDDANSNNSCTDGTQTPYIRTNKWINVTSSMQFVIPPPSGAKI